MEGCALGVDLMKVRELCFRIEGNKNSNLDNAEERAGSVGLITNRVRFLA